MPQCVFMDNAMMLCPPRGDEDVGLRLTAQPNLPRLKMPADISIRHSRQKHAGMTE
jgi:hypothetical protein